MLDRKPFSDTRQPSANDRPARKSPEQAVDEYDNIRPNRPKKANPIPKRPRSLLADDDLHAMIVTQPLTEKVHIQTEYGNQDFRPSKPVDQINQVFFGPAIFLAIRNK